VISVIVARFERAATDFGANIDASPIKTEFLILAKTAIEDLPAWMFASMA
jgi:hypothetical protein